ncbi:MAG: sulfite exporter TauE/SafE family protein [Magnetococcales bacterium]|nr:sulfite exporter TauE/SafE family protein [Magnetococcales bacterium]MBF0348106.1 sulfite exporter TauE/SafE family protein [Magnetococcales bacterium]
MSQLFGFFLVGLFSTAHCLLMCGAIVGALTISLPVSVRERRGVLVGYLAAWNGGRIAGYTLAGFLAGALGELLVLAFGLEYRHSSVLSGLSLLFLVGIGMYIADWLPGVARLEKIGVGLWRILEPFAQSLLPVSSRSRALVFGLLWGWFPCGLTYTVLIWSATVGGPLKGAAAMAAFGLGTLPGLLLAGFFSSRLFIVRQSVWVKRGLGLLLVGYALVMGVWFQELGEAPSLHHPGVSGEWVE